MKKSYLFLKLAMAGLVLPMAPMLLADSAEAANSAQAQPAAKLLGVGSPAPKLEVAQWLQGEPVTEFADDKVYLVEAWATWCGPCIAGIPHLNELHTKFKDKGFVVIGVNLWESASAEKVTEFVKKRDDMTYRIAYDGGRSGPVANNWLKAAGVNGIPHAFVVKKGQIVWKGHPARLTEDVVTSILDEGFSLEQAIAAEKARTEQDAKAKTAQDKYQELLRNKEYEAAYAQADVVAAHASEASRDRQRLFLQYRVRLSQQDYQKALDLADQLVAAAPEQSRAVAALQYKLLPLNSLNDYDGVIKVVDEALVALPEKGAQRINYILRYKIPAVQKKSGPAAARDELKKLVAEDSSNAVLLAEGAAWIVRTEDLGEVRDLALAEKWAKDSLALESKPGTSAKAVAHLALAGVAFWRGDAQAGDAEGSLALEAAPAQLKNYVTGELQRIKKLAGK